MATELKLPESLEQLREWVENRPKQKSVCGDMEHCIIADWLMEHNTGLYAVSVEPNDYPNGEGMVCYYPFEDRKWLDIPLPTWLNDLAVSFDKLAPKMFEEVGDLSYKPTKEAVLGLFEQQKDGE